MIPIAKDLPPHHVIVRFGSAIPSTAQGAALLAFERSLRELSGVRCEVFKETMADDSKLRRSMTTEQRNAL